MNQEYRDFSQYRIFRRLAAEYRRYKATEYLCEIWCHPDTPISASQLYSLFNIVQPPCLETDQAGFYYPDSRLRSYFPPELPIAICDQTTLSQVRASVASLHSSLRQARYENDLARIEDLEDQLDQCVDYLKDCVTSHKRLRYLNNLDHDLSLLIYRSVQSLYRILRGKYPELVEYLEQHAHVGVKCYWSETPLKPKAKPDKN